MVKEDTILSRKIPLQLTSQQRKQLQIYNDHTRWMFNKTLNEIKNNKNYNKKQIRSDLVINNHFEYYYKNKLITFKEFKEYNKKLTKKEKEKFLTSKKFENNNIPEWIKKTPQIIKEFGVFQCIENYKTCKTNKKNKNIKNFNMNYRSKKIQKNWTIKVGKGRNVFEKKNNILQILNMDMKYPKNESLPNKKNNELWKSEKECFIHYSWNDNRYYLIIPYSKEIKQLDYISKPAISIDPGIRRFATCYSSDNKGFILGDNCTERINKELKKLDIIISLLNKKDEHNKSILTHKKRKKLLRRYDWKNRKIFSNLNVQFQKNLPIF